MWRITQTAPQLQKPNQTKKEKQFNKCSVLNYSLRCHVCRGWKDFSFGSFAFPHKFEADRPGWFFDRDPVKLKAQENASFYSFAWGDVCWPPGGLFSPQQRLADGRYHYSLFVSHGDYCIRFEDKLHSSSYRLPGIVSWIKLKIN